ncbi:MAG: hypothetical protein IH984_14905 [Planctomycetes bacterium]|nr:hypothetical protein [Planctomycetota bacterium]
MHVAINLTGTPETEPFEKQAALVLRELKASLLVLIGSIPGAGEIKKAADLQRALRIRTTLAWQVYKFALSADPLAEGCNIPGVGALKRFLDEAVKHGVPTNCLDSCRSAISSFEELIETHAGSRTAFDSMIASLTADGSDQIDAQQKRAAFRANSHIWGVQAKTRLACYIYDVAANATDKMDVAVIRGLVDLRRLRSGASWTIARIGISDDDGKSRHPVIREPIDPQGEIIKGVPLLRAFCSEPIPTFTSMPAAFGMTNVQIEGDSIGNQSSITCILGDISRCALARYQDEHNLQQTSQALVRTPCEVLIHDVLVGKGIMGDISPELAIYGDHRSGDAIPEERECDLLPMRESITYLGKGPSVMHTPDIPGYAEMIQYTFDRLGRDGSLFDVYRCRVEYPVMPSSVVVRFDLPQRPSSSEE